MSNIQLYCVQLHVSALCIGHHRAVLSLGVWGVVGRGLVPSPLTPPRITAYCIVARQV